MKKFFARLVTSCMVLFTSFSSFVVPIMAQEVNEQNAMIKVSVVGDGKVLLKNNEFSTEISTQEIFKREFPLNSDIELIFVEQKDTLESVVVNQQQIVVDDSSYSFQLKENSEVQVTFKSKEESIPAEKQKVDNKDISTQNEESNVFDENDPKFQAYIHRNDEMLSQMKNDILKEDKVFSTFNENRAGKVQITWTDNYQYKLSNGYGWDENLYVIDNKYKGFCAEAYQAGANYKTWLDAPVEIDNANLRKVLYYGAEGPKDILTPRYGKAGAVCFTNEMCSMVFSGRTVADIFGIPGGFSNNIGPVYYEILAKPDPKSVGFTAYICKNNNYGIPWHNSFTHVGSIRCQHLVFGKQALPKKGSLKIKKYSAIPSITDGNSCYSLKGAQYGVYKDKNVSNKVATLTIENDGWSNQVNLDSGQYYVKETKAPLGYALNTSIIPVTINSGKTTSINDGTFKDLPQSDPIQILLNKVDADTGKPVPVGDGSLEGAEYTFKYYSEAMSTDPATSGKSPKRTWVLKTDKDGFVYLHKDYKVSGDDFYYNGTSNPTLPIGTVTIQETKAPEGYHLNSEMFVRQITPKGTAETIKTYNAPTSKENSVSLTLKKYQSNSKIMISGAEFEHVMPDGSKEIVKTNSQGVLTLKGLHRGKHTLKEVKVKDGYVIRPETITLNVASNGRITMSNAASSGISFTNDSLGNGVLEIKDDVKEHSLQIIKVNDHGKLLDGAEFTLYSDKECMNAIETQTTQNGELWFKSKIKDRTHYYLKETKAPAGYRIPLEMDHNGSSFVHVYDVYAESTPEKGIFDFWIDGVKYNVNSTTGDIHLEGTEADRVISIKVVNYVGKVMPHTGSNGTILWVSIGIAFVAIGYCLTKRKKS